MATLRDEEVLKILAHFKIDDDPVAVIGIAGTESGNQIGVYDDRFYVHIGERIHTFVGNVEPSNLARGRATLLKMRVFHWRAGIHGLSKPRAKQYGAFVQAEAVTVMRHQQGADTGWFGINHHRGGRGTTSSLGCQTYHPDEWEEAKALLYGAIGANNAAVIRNERSGKPFPYVVVPYVKAKLIGAGAANEDQPVIIRTPDNSTSWSIRIKGKPGEPDEVYDGGVNIAGRVFVPIRDFCSALLDCEPKKAPLEWVEDEKGEDVLKVGGKPVEEVTEIGERAYVWIVEAAEALGYDIARNMQAKNLILTPKP